MSYLWQHGGKQLAFATAATSVRQGELRDEVKRSIDAASDDEEVHGDEVPAMLEDVVEELLAALRDAVRHADVKEIRNADVKEIRHADVKEIRHADVKEIRHADVKEIRCENAEGLRHVDRNKMRDEE